MYRAFLDYNSSPHLNISARPCLAHDVLRLEVEMDDVLLVHVSHSLADLAHVVRCLGLAHVVARFSDAFEKLASGQAGIEFC